MTSGRRAAACPVEVVDAFRVLAPLHRQVLLVTCLRGRRVEQAAADLGTDPAGVCDLLHDALRAFGAVVDPRSERVPGCHFGIAAYVVDALDGPLAAAVEAHLPGCGPCGAELEQLDRVAAPLRALRGTVLPLDHPDRAPVAVTPSHGLPRAVVRAPAPQRARAASRELRPARRLRLGRGQVLPGVAVAALATAGLLSAAGPGDLQVSRQPQVSPAAVRGTATDPATRVRAEVSLTPRPGATDVAVSLRSPADVPRRCRLVALRRDGERTVLGLLSFAEGRSGKASVTAPLDAEDIEALVVEEVVDGRPETLVTVTL